MAEVGGREELEAGEEEEEPEGEELEDGPRRLRRRFDVGAEGVAGGRAGSGRGDRAPPEGWAGEEAGLLGGGGSHRSTRATNFPTRGLARARSR